MIASVVAAKRSTLRLPYLDYLVPPALESKITIGQLVKIPLRAREEFGVIIALNSAPQRPSVKMKSIISLVADWPLLPLPQLNFLSELSALYHVSLGFILKNNLLPLQKRKLAILNKLSPPAFLSKNPAPVKPKAVIYKNQQERLACLNKIIASPGQILIILPEIVNLKQIEALIGPPAGETIFISGELTDKELFAAWLKIWAGEKRIIIGTRRAFFLPFSNLTNIVVDDEANPDHKSYDMAPRIHNRDAALILAKHHGSALHLLSPALSVETYFFARQKIYQAAEILPAIKPDFNIISLSAPARAGDFNAVSEELRERINNTAGLVFLLCHRRGAFAHLCCSDCKKTLACPNCRQALTLHAQANRLKCHHCHAQTAVPVTCPACGGAVIKNFGAGTETVAQEVKTFLSAQRKIVILDNDHAPAPELKSDDIVVGTNFAWRYLDPKEVKLFALIDADTLLFVPEYKTTENMWQEIFSAAVALPSGCQINIQTSQPEHGFFQNLRQPEKFYEQELATRRLFGYPPFYYLLKLFTADFNASALSQKVRLVYDNLLNLTKTSGQIKISTPADMFPAFYKSQYWKMILLKIPYSNYKKNIKLILSHVPEDWKADPNPLTIISHN